LHLDAQNFRDRNRTPTPNDNLVSFEVNNDGSATFRLYAPDAKSVALGGYKLNPESPGINTGIFIPWNSVHDFFGNPVLDGSVDIGAYEQIGSGVFADKALEKRINNTAMIKNRLALAKRNFPLTIRKPEDGRIVINISEPIDSHITGIISLNSSEIKAKPAVIFLEKAKDRNFFVFSLPKSTQSNEDISVQILLDYNGISEEWVIPVVEQTMVRRR